MILADKLLTTENGLILFLGLFMGLTLGMIGTFFYIHRNRDE